MNCVHPKVIDTSVSVYRLLGVAIMFRVASSRSVSCPRVPCRPSCPSIPIPSLLSLIYPHNALLPHITSPSHCPVFHHFLYPSLILTSLLHSYCTLYPSLSPHCSYCPHSIQSHLSHFYIITLIYAHSYLPTHLLFIWSDSFRLNLTCLIPDRIFSYMCCDIPSKM
jgi:hypothetical protein